MKNIFTKIAATVATSAAISVALAQIAPKANAASLTISNPGFEAPVLGDNEYTIRDVPGWQAYDPNNFLSTPPGEVVNYAVLNPASYSYPGEAPEGNNVGALYVALPPGSGVFGLTQILSSVLMANTIYNLQVQVGNPNPDEYVEPGFPGYAVQLLAGGNIIAQDYNTLNPAEGLFATSMVNYTALANDPNLGKPLEIRLLHLAQNPGTELGFDDVRLDATKVPEPTSILGLLGLGAIGATSAFLCKTQQIFNKTLHYPRTSPIYRNFKI